MGVHYEDNNCTWQKDSAKNLDQENINLLKKNPDQDFAYQEKGSIRYIF